MKKLPISAIIASKNEGHLLEACLKSIQFCDEIVVVNLQSTDETREIADKYATKVIDEEVIPYVEEILKTYRNKVKNEWIFTIDPDEVYSEALATELIANFSKYEKELIAGVMVPIRYYFKKQMLKGTPWGGLKYRLAMFHRDRYTITGIVHNGGFVNNGFTMIYLDYTGENHVHHFWMSSISQIFEKHLRYLKSEGESRYQKGLRVKWYDFLTIFFKQFFNSYVKSRGFKDGLIGVFLSAFRSWYMFNVYWETWKYQRSLKTK